MWIYCCFSSSFWTSYRQLAIIALTPQKQSESLCNLLIHLMVTPAFHITDSCRHIRMSVRPRFWLVSISLLDTSLVVEIPSKYRVPYSGPFLLMMNISTGLTSIDHLGWKFKHLLLMNSPFFLLPGCMAWRHKNQAATAPKATQRWRQGVTERSWHLVMSCGTWPLWWLFNLFNIVYIKEVSHKHDEHEDSEHLMVILKVRVTVVTGKIVLKRG